MARSLFLAASILLVLSAATSCNASRKLEEEPLNGGLPVDVRAAVEESWAVAKSAVASGDHELFSSLFAPEARVNVPNHHPITGAVGEAWDKLLSFLFKGASPFSGNITTSDAIYLKNKHASNGKEYFVLTRNAYNLTEDDSNVLGDTGASIALFQWLPLPVSSTQQIAAALGLADPPKIGQLKFRWFASNSDQDEEGSAYASLDNMFEPEDDEELAEDEVDALFGELGDPPLEVRLARTVNATWNHFHRSILAKDIHGVKRIFSDDVHLYPPFTSSISGLGEKLEEALEKLFGGHAHLTAPTRTFNELMLLKGKVKRKVGGVKTKVKHFVLEESDYEHSDDSANGWFTSKGKQMVFWELQKPKSLPAYDDLALGGSVLKKDVLKLGWAMWNGNAPSKHSPGPAPAPKEEPTEAPAPTDAPAPKEEPTEAPTPKEAPPANEIMIV